MKRNSATSPLGLLAQEMLKKRKGEDLLRNLPPIEKRAGKKIIIDGKEYLNACSNDYLAMSRNHTLAEVIAASAKQEGVGSGASRLVTGNHPLYRKAEKAIEEYFQIPNRKAVLFGSGYAGNAGIISALASLDRTELFFDALSHASLIDGGLLSVKRPRIHRFRHCDISHLEELLQKSKAPVKIVISDGVFSMDGDFAPLDSLIKLKEKLPFFLVVDDAHGIGVLGRKGRGLYEETALKNPEAIDALTGTFGKAFGLYGAFLLAEESVCSLMVNGARSLIYSTALPPMLLAGITASLVSVQRMTEEREYLKKISTSLRRELRENGYHIPNGITPIIPVMLGSNKEATAMAERCREKGVYVTPIRPPTVPKGSARLRLTLSSDFTTEDLAQIMTAFQPQERNR